MGLKIFKALWFLSMLAVLGNLLYIYAGLPEMVLIKDERLVSTSIEKETFFYLGLLSLTVVNVMVYLVSRSIPNDLDTRAWFHGLVITLNVFFVVTFSLIGLVNSAERYDFGRIGFTIYGSVILVVGWAISWPLYKIFTRLTAK
jgi:hypothetical protein